MTTAPRIDSLESTTGGLSVSLQTPVVNLTYRTATTATGVAGAGLFHSNITGRARMVDLSNDLMPRIGVERIQIQQITRVTGEIGANSEIVLKPVNDKFDQVRFVGGWKNYLDTGGASATSDNASNPNGTNYAEFTFYGTGLNLLIVPIAGADVRITVDGLSESVSNINPISGGSEILRNRNYAANLRWNVASNLALGVHTVKLRVASNNTFGVHGMEVLNEATTIKTAPGTCSIGGKLLTNASLSSQAYASGFDSGTLGTRGGRVVVYHKADGSIGKSVTPTDASALTMSSADHSNEEVVRNYFIREFGSGRTVDDFSTLNAATVRAFTLDDGVTTLASTNVEASLFNGTDALLLNAASGFVTFTFVGTGCDLRWGANGTGTNSNANSFTASIDGGAELNLPTVGIDNGAGAMQKIASGLPYGTHTIKIRRNSPNVWSLRVLGFTIYSPKKPALPTGAVELGEYSLLANYAIGSPGINFKSTGVVSKYGTREFIYNGAGWNWAGANVSNFGSGHNITSAVSGNYFEYTFFGTGIEHKNILFTGTVNMTYTLNGNPPSFYGATTTLATGTIASLTFPTSGLLSGTATGSQQDGAIVSISNLPLGTYKLKVLQNTAQSFYGDSVEVITPIHSHINNGPFTVQNTLSVGSNYISDSRKFGSQLYEVKAVNAAIGISTTTVTSTTFVPLIDSFTTIYSPGAVIDFSSFMRNAPGANFGLQNFQLYINGEAQLPELYSQDTTSGESTKSLVSKIYLPKGYHTIYMMWRVGSGTGSSGSNMRRFNTSII